MLIGTFIHSYIQKYEVMFFIIIFAITTTTTT